MAVALGSNLGDRREYIQSGLTALSDVVQNLRVSKFYETEPVGVDAQPMFLNAAAIGCTALSALPLLEQMLAIEQRLGRHRSQSGAARTLDLDLILFGDLVITTPNLMVPHPRFREREFVLTPLAEIAADWIDPVSGMRVGALLTQLGLDGTDYARSAGV